MAGGNIYCGTFESRDKSGSAFSGVLESIRPSIQKLALNIDEQLKDQEYVVFSVEQAKGLIPVLTKYRDDLIKEIGHDDFDKEIYREESEGMDPVNGKYGLSRGWKLYCVNDLIIACETSIDENQEIGIVFG